MDIQVRGPDGHLKTPVCDADGKLVVTGIAGGGGGAGDASAANQTTQIAQIGEVQSSPTANTVLDRLKTLASLIGEVQASPTSNTLLDRVKGLATLLAGGLPAALTAGGGLKTGLVDALPPGTNTIGKVGSDTFSTATLSSVSASASNQTLLAANANRKCVIIHNDSTATMYIKFGAAASATSFTYCLYGGDTYESPALPIYTGIIDGIWASATGAARITEGT